MPRIASDGIHDTEVTDDSTRHEVDDRAASLGEDCSFMSTLDDLRRGDVSALDAVTACIDAAAGRGRDQRDRRLRGRPGHGDAARLDRAFAEHGAVGPLHGLPITVKDWIDVEGFPCAGESAEPMTAGRRPDATVVARLRRAGAVVVAKTRPWGDVGG